MIQSFWARNDSLASNSGKDLVGLECSEVGVVSHVFHLLKDTVHHWIKIYHDFKSLLKTSHNCNFSSDILHVLSNRGDRLSTSLGGGSSLFLLGSLAGSLSWFNSFLLSDGWSSNWSLLSRSGGSSSSSSSSSLIFLLLISLAKNLRLTIIELRSSCFNIALRLRNLLSLLLNLSCQLLICRLNLVLAYVLSWFLHTNSAISILDYFWNLLSHIHWLLLCLSILLRLFLRLNDIIGDPKKSLSHLLNESLSSLDVISLDLLLSEILIFIKGFDLLCNGLLSQLLHSRLRHLDLLLDNGVRAGIDLRFN